MRHSGNARDGIAYLDNADLYVENLKSLDGKRIQVTVEEYKEAKTPEQLGYFFGGILPTAMEHESFGGWEKEEIREYLEGKFLQKTYVKQVNGENVCVFITQTVGDLNKQELSAFIDKVLSFLATMGIQVLAPEQYRLDRYRTK